MKNIPPWTTPLHEKAEYGTLKDVKNLTTETLNLVADLGNTVWHIAAQYGTLNDIPRHLFTGDALAQKIWLVILSGMLPPNIIH